MVDAFMISSISGMSWISLISSWWLLSSAIVQRFCRAEGCVIRKAGARSRINTAQKPYTTPHPASDPLFQQQQADARGNAHTAIRGAEKPCAHAWPTSPRMRLAACRGVSGSGG
uniref:Putative secreted protein n=1 Tax=Ixodes ricinus TaxID=34613 RepID=A0A6B0UKF9_IXORI